MDAQALGGSSVEEAEHRCEDSEDKESIMNKVDEHKDGYTFGELALISRKPRAATIHCAKNCHLAVLDRRAFQLV